MKLEEVNAMSVTDMIDALGDLNDLLKENQKSANILKEAIKARIEDDGDTPGDRFFVSLNRRVRHGLSSEWVKQDMGDEWYEAHCVDTEYREVRVKPLSAQD